MKNRFAAAAGLLLGVGVTLAFTQPCFAGFRFNHMIYDCALDSEAPAGNAVAFKGEIYEATPEGSDMKQDLAGQWLSAGTIVTATGRAVYFGSSTVRPGWLDPDVVTIKVRPEIFAEEPTSFSLSLNLRTLRGAITYKKWKGYAPVGPADVKLTAPIKCEKVDRSIN